jgi:hypothetical protein
MIAAIKYQPFRFRVPALRQKGVLRCGSMSDEHKPSGPPVARPIAVDPLAQSASQNEPAFIARPKDAPVYHGFPVLSDVVVDGFTFGKITDFEIEPCTEGDAFVIAPDNSRAGLVWEVSEDSYFQEVCAADSARWGVWAVSFPHSMASRENVRKNLQHVIPQLKERWQEWRKAQLSK